MSTVLFDSDPATGRVRLFHTMPDGTFLLESRHPGADHVAEANHDVRKQYDERSRWRDLDRVASIPMVLFHKLRRLGILQDKRALKKWVNDPDNRIWRTRPGRV